MNKVKVKYKIEELKLLHRILLANIKHPKRNLAYLERHEELIKQILINSHITINYIRKMVSDYYNIPNKKLDEVTRKREIVQARQVAMSFAKKLTGKSLSHIGAEIGGKDHATVLHACKTIENLIDTDKVFRNQVKDIEVRL